MNKAAAIVTGCIVLAILWAWRPDKPSSPPTSHQNTISARLPQASNSPRPSSGHDRNADKSKHPAWDGYGDVSGEPAPQVADEPTESPANESGTFWTFAPEQSPPLDAQESGLTLDQFERPYTMTLTEEGFAQLTAADRSVAIDEIATALRQARSEASNSYAQADADIAFGDYGNAEIILLSEVERLGEFNANKEGLYLTRIMGISLQQTALTKLETLYSRTGNHARLKMTQQQWQNLEWQKRQMQTAQMEQAL